MVSYGPIANYHEIRVKPMIVSPKLRPLSRSEVREVDRRSIEECHLPGIVLMENAGRGATEVLLELGLSEPVYILAGKGNNGGDGFVIARFLQLADIRAHVLTPFQQTDVGSDALIQMNVLLAAGIPIEFGVTATDIADRVTSASWIIDALLGTGAQGAVREPVGAIAEVVNKSAARVVSIDVPTGLDCDTGKPLGCSVRADDTITFVAPKIGFGSGSATEYTGRVHVVGIGAPLCVLEDFVVR